MCSSDVSQVDVEIVKPYTKTGLWKWQKLILAHGQVNCHKILVQGIFLLVLKNTKEQITHKELSLAVNNEHV